MWARLLRPTLTRREYVGYSECAVPAPTVEALRGYKVIGIFFGADWCKPCMVFKPGLKKLYSAQAAQGADQLEIVLASRCRKAKATKKFSLGMPWRAMYHDANNKISMKSRTTALMAKFGIITIPALVLLDKRGQVICKDGRGWCAADPMGLAFPWRGKAKGGPVARAVVHFDLPPAKQGQQPASPTQILPPN